MNYFRKILILLASMALFFTASLVWGESGRTPLPFDDIGNSYGQKQIVDLYERHIVNGTGQRTFEPDKPVSRAEFTAMVNRVLNVKPVASDIPAFDDVPRSAWYYGAVQAALLLQVIDGTGARTFEPQQPITRQEAAAVLVRAFKQARSKSPVEPAFKDASRIAAWAVPYVGSMQQLGLMNGDAGIFRPNDPLTRQETAVVLARALERPGWSAALKANPPQSIQMGWQYELTTQQYIARVEKSTVNTLSPRWYYLDKTQTVADHTDRELIDWAKKNGKKIWAMVGNGFNADLTHSVLTDSNKRDAVIGQLTTYVRQYGLDGLNLDFENVYPQDREAFTAFVSKLAAELHLLQAVLSVDVSPDLGTDWTAAFDYAALGTNADYIVLMGYDEHWDGAPAAGSVSSLPWVQRGIDKLITMIPSEKLIVGLPLYTRDWSLKQSGTTAQDLTLAEQGNILRAHKPKMAWDANIGQYTADYMQQGVPHRIWTEDSRSLSVKSELVEQRNIAGFAYWSVGSETIDIWDALRNHMKFSSYSFSAK
ncbi:S-layer homology domain-containing protein [Paenibacillus sp. MER TA 81-3]|uniref:S-layer homology domain-containing protein n=1 Tax=Paenibacillus sp. MER TA 81-3 TaxID=2939573 RepID=UPI00203E9271|nr:S-layer homology domain-containing protein [Paenibacillus sp. MER TA 81-3]MCM3342626.1 S-layer homology domain-containing protein [Paenibacillus sp. MER TA 81-3]